MRPTYPIWLTSLSWTSLALAGVCAAVIAVDEWRRPQKMAVMNLVWPLAALFGSVFWLALYWGAGRAPTGGQVHTAHHHAQPQAIAPLSIAKSASHCGAGCALGDIVAEWLCFWLPPLAVAFGWKSVFAEKTFAVWVLDLLLAFGIGVIFQYAAIKPMKPDASPAAVLIQALKADALSIAAWQVGMYGVMAIAQFGWMRPTFGALAPVDTPEFWLVMQIAMIGGFFTSFPANWWLVKAGLKEAM